MKATFSNTVDILVKAYLNDTLEHGNCHACAVGNIVAASCGFTYKTVKKDRVKFLWSHLSTYHNPDPNTSSWYGHVKYTTNQSEESKRQILATGYSADELLLIENAFEDAQWLKGDAMFNGLMAVVDVLAEIHNVDLTVKESAKLLFVK